MITDQQSETIDEWTTLLESTSLNALTDPVSPEAAEALLENFISGGLLTDLIKLLAGVSPDKFSGLVLDTMLLLETELACSLAKTLCEGLSHHVTDYWCGAYDDEGVPGDEYHAWRIMLASLSGARDHSGLPLLWGALDASPDDANVQEALFRFLPLAQERFFELLDAPRREIRLAGIEILERAMQLLGPPPVVLDSFRTRLSEMVETDRSNEVRERAEEALVAIKGARTTHQTLEAEPATALFLFDLTKTEGGQGFDGINSVHRAVLSAIGEAIGGWETNTHLIRGCHGDLFPWTAPGMDPTLKVLLQILGTESSKDDPLNPTSVDLDRLDTDGHNLVPYALGLGPLSCCVTRDADTIIRATVGEGYLGVAGVFDREFRSLVEDLTLLPDLEVKQNSARGQWQLSRNELKSLGLKRGHRTTTPKGNVQ